MIPDQYIWLTWAGAFLIPWAILYRVFPHHRRIMLRTSLPTLPFSLTAPMFIPAYWSPPSLFDLARTTGFDVEGFIYCFGNGGVAAEREPARGNDRAQTNGFERDDKRQPSAYLGKDV